VVRRFAASLDAMNHLRTICLVALAGSLLGCDPLEPSDEGQYDLRVGLFDALGADSNRVLVGSRFEVEIDQLRVEGELDPAGGGLNCAASTASGSLTKTGAIEFLVETAGPGVVEFAPPIESCPENDDVLVELGPDRWSMIGVEPSAATGSWVGAGDNAVRDWRMSPGPAGTFPDALGLPLDDARVAAEGRFLLLPLLLDPSVGTRAEIRWADPDAVVSVPEHYEEIATHVEEDGERHAQTYLDGSLRAGDSVDASITILATEFDLPALETVPVREITDLELVPVYFPGDGDEREWGLPAGVVAITRDGEGRRVMGAPVAWSVTRGKVSAYSVNFGDDVLEIGDCRDEPKRAEWRAATIVAELEDLSAEVELEWVALPSDDIDPTSDVCEGSACNCSTTTSPSDSVFATLALLALLGLRRRRSSTTRSAA
jgi:MYXO-CTERM domain-containing protein